MGDRLKMAQGWLVRTMDLKGITCTAVQVKIKFLLRIRLTQQNIIYTSYIIGVFKQHAYSKIEYK